MKIGAGAMWAVSAQALLTLHNALSASGADDHSDTDMALVLCSGLHFTAAIGNAECTRMLCEAGADIDLGDKQGDNAAATNHYTCHWSSSFHDQCHTQCYKVCTDRAASAASALCCQGMHAKPAWLCARMQMLTSSLLERVHMTCPLL